MIHIQPEVFNNNQLQNMQIRKWFKQKSLDDNLIAIVKTLIYHLHVPVTISTIEKELTNHSKYPSFYSIRDVLNNWGIINKTFKIQKDRIKEINFPSIAYLENIKSFVLLKSIDDNKLNYLDTSKGWQKVSISDFNEWWDGIVLMAFPSENAGENDYVSKKNTNSFGKLKKSLFYVFLSLILLFPIYKYIYINKLYPDSGYIIGINLLGCFFSFILLKIEFLKSSLIINRICHFGKYFDCKSVLKTKISKLGGIISLAEASFFYFTGSYIFISFGVFLNQYLKFVSFLAIIQIPILIFSVFLIFYQALSVKKWCFFCLIIQILLWSELYFLKTRLDFSLSLNMSDVYVTLFCFAISPIFWYIYKSYIFTINEINKKQRLINYFEQNSIVISSLVNSSVLIEDLFIPNEIILGNKKSNNCLILLISPYCRFCKSALLTLLKIAIENENLKIIIRFSMNNNTNEMVLKMIRNIVNLNYLNNSESAVDAIKTWYSQSRESVKSVNLWLKEINNNKIASSDIIDQYIIKNIQWVNSNNLNYTPAFIINNCVFPPYLDYSVLIKYIAELSSNYEPVV
jgi:uncharacterized membrane protein